MKFEKHRHTFAVCFRNLVEIVSFKFFFKRVVSEISENRSAWFKEANHFARRAAQRAISYFCVTVAKSSYTPSWFTFIYP